MALTAGLPVKATDGDHIETDESLPRWSAWVEIPHASILTLKTVGFDLLAAPGASKYLKVFEVEYWSVIVTEYTGVVSGSYLEHKAGVAGADLGFYLQNNEFISGLTELFATVGSRLVAVERSRASVTAAEFTQPLYSYDPSDLVNTPFTLKLNNAANLGGGAAGNKLFARVFHSTFAAPV